MDNERGILLLDDPLSEIELSEIVTRAAADLGLVAGRPVSDAKRDTRKSWGFDNIIPRMNSYSFQPKLGANTLETLRLVIDRDPDASKAMTNFTLLIGKGYKTTAGTKKKNGSITPDPQGAAEIEELDQQVGGEYGGGMKAVINVAIHTLIHQGAIALEAELDKTLTSVIDCHPVNPALIHFEREKATGRLMRGVFDQDAKFVELNPRQFLYVPFHPMVGNPYGRSPILAALTALFFKIELLADLRAVVHNQGHPRLDITVVMEQITKAIPAYLRQKGKEADLRKFVEDEIRSVAEAYKKLNPDDSFIHGDNVTVDYKGPSGAMDFKSLSEILDNQIIAGVKQLPVLLGRNEGATTTHATVQWEIFATEIEAFQDVVAGAIQWFHNLGLAVRGRTSTAATSFQKPQTRDRKAEAEARAIEITNEFALADRGYVTEDEAANTLVGHGVVAEPKPVVAPVASDSGTNIDTTKAAKITERGTGHGEVRQHHALQRYASGGRIRATHDPRDPGQADRPEGHAHDHAGSQQHQPDGDQRQPVRSDRPQVQLDSRLVRGSLPLNAPDVYGTVVASGAFKLEPECRDGQIVAVSLVHNWPEAVRRVADTMYPGPEAGTVEEELTPFDFRDPAYIEERRRYWYDHVWQYTPYAQKNTAPKSWQIHRRADDTIDHEANLDDMIDSVLPDVQDRWDDLKERFPSRDVAEGKTTASEWFTTASGIEWMGAFRTLLVDHYRDVFDVRGGLALEEIGIEGVFRLENPEVLAALEEFGLNRVTGMAEETIDQILRVLQNGTANGDHPRDIARAIRAQIDGMSATRAYTIARTETAHAYSYAAQECYARNGVKKKEWLTAQDRKVDPPCPEYAAEGAINIRAQFGGTHDHPPAHPNCFPGDVLVSGPQPLGSTEREYVGNLATIRTSAGHELTATPNHPILTDQGWIAAGSLREGDRVLCRVDSQGMATCVGPDEQDRPSRIEDVACSFGEARGGESVTVPVAAEDFHGDGRDGDVAIVRADSLLWYDGNPYIPAPADEEAFQVGNVAVGKTFARQGAGIQIVTVANHAAHGAMRGENIPGVFCGGSPRIHQPISSRVVASIDASRVKSSVDSTAGYAIPDRDTVDRIAGHVEFCEIVKVDSVDFSGHVFNLQTSEGWYVANGIVTHNCRCALIPNLDGFDVPDDGDEWTGQ